MPRAGMIQKATIMSGSAMRTMELKSNRSRRQATPRKMMRPTMRQPGEEWGPKLTE